MCQVIQDLVVSTDFPSSCPTILWCNSTNLWIRPETGDICLGPAGPPLSHPFFIFQREYLGPYPNVPPLPPNVYNNHTLFDYVLKNATNEHVLQAFSDQATRSRLHLSEFVHYRNINHIWSSVQFDQQTVARFPAPSWILTFRCSSDVEFPHSAKPPETIMEDGRFRLTITNPHIPISWIQFDTNRDRRISHHEAWLSQAVYVFNVLGVPREEWEGYTLGDTIMDLYLFSHRGNTQVPLDAQLKPPCYLFVLPPPRLPDTTPDVASWLQAPAESLYYWSLDPNGDSVMPETQRVALGLPLYYQNVIPLELGQWKAEVYDLVRQWQEAKGFDPATTDFARSMGYPIVEILPQDDDRFESKVEVDEDANTEPPGWEPMQVDECPNFEAMPDSQYPIMQSERLGGSILMDVEMEDSST
ncbi:hypothetical protein PM082_016784 [Marasmius tenuissimus]|nr:hypothetical protein PM082_016784 [Marasmius tenuissimus]